MTFTVVDALGECYAIRETEEAAEEARRDATAYLDEAAACGHRLAPAWVAKRLPVVVRRVSEKERDDLLDEGTPLLDREP